MLLILTSGGAFESIFSVKGVPARTMALTGIAESNFHVLLSADHRRRRRLNANTIKYKHVSR